MTQRFDVAVVGSGFGGSILACRLAQARRSVCVLERGRRWNATDFPRSPNQVARDGFCTPTARRATTTARRQAPVSVVSDRWLDGLIGGVLDALKIPANHPLDLRLLEAPLATALRLAAAGPDPTEERRGL